MPVFDDRVVEAAGQLTWLNDQDRRPEGYNSFLKRVAMYPVFSFLAPMGS